MLRPHPRPFILASLTALAILSPSSVRSLPFQEADSRTWVGRHHEVEEYLRTAECDRLENMGPATVALQRCVLRPGGPIARLAWKPLLPGVTRGFQDSYKANIAAYELDKLLTLDMVPPAVERVLQGLKGSATQWVENIAPLKRDQAPDAAYEKHWNAQVAKMVMFDTLIHNPDRNLNNVLHDPAWNMILLDHTMAFGTSTDLVRKMVRIDRDFWARIDKLTRGQLDAALRPWLEDGEIAAMLARRDRMRTEIKAQVGDFGAR